MGGAAKAVTGALTHVVGGATGSIIGSTLMGPVGALVGGGMGLVKGGNIFGSSGSKNPTMAGGMENPAAVLAQSGGAPLLANVAMGVDPKSAIASYFGASNYDEFYNKLGDSDKKLVDGVTSQLTQIQGNTDMKNKALQGIVNDFPNIAAQAAQAHQAAGGEFDAVTKDYLDKALGANAAKYGANGGLSSGAEIAAAGRVGADMGMQKLNYMTQAGDTAFNQGAQGWQARYNEANALRNFQNLMTQGAAGQGFSAVQASLNRNQQTNLTNAGFANQQNLQNQQNDNAMFGAIGGLAGTIGGAALLGPMGGMLGGKAGSGAAGGNTAAPSFPQGQSSMNMPMNYPQTPRLNYGGF
jgi:hypothetical protein